ncbi:MAG: septal ring lytic transglycosylase RlpA family protein [Desulfococcaceae bacterium]
MKKKNRRIFPCGVCIGLSIVLPFFFGCAAPAVQPQPLGGFHKFNKQRVVKKRRLPVPSSGPVDYYSASCRPYKVGDTWYKPLAHAKDFRQRGIASWYGEDFHGKATSSGEIYDMHGISAAHKILPLHTWVRVRNLANGKSLVVRINDRGPFVAGRIIDLSIGAARELGVYGPGTSEVEIEALGIARPGGSKTPMQAMYMPVDYDKGTYAIQVAAFGDRGNAEKFAHQLRQTYEYAQIKPAYCPEGKQKLYRVLVGKCTSLEQAELYQNTLKSKGFQNIFIIAD